MEVDIDISRDDRIEIGIILYPGAQMAAALGMTDMFLFADRIAQAQPAPSTPRLRVSHWRKEGEGAAERVFDTGSGDRGGPAILLLPPALGEPPAPPMAGLFAPWLRESHQRGTVLGSICAGAFLLGEAGLLDWRRATTHWAYSDVFRGRFPNVHLDIDRLLVDEGDIITAGGVMAWTDLSLRLIDRFLGASIMADTARSFLVDPPGREQRFYSVFSPRLDHGDAAVVKVQHWLQSTGAGDARLSRLAQEAGLEERTLLRRFKKATGITTIEYCQRLRVGRAQEMLRLGGATIDRIAWDVGYSDVASFRKLFARIVGLTPGEYRQRFRVTENPGPFR